MLGIVLAEAILFAFLRLPILLFGGIQRLHFRGIGKIGKSGSAIQAARILEIDQRTAGITMEGFHFSRAAKRVDRRSDTRPGVISIVRSDIDPSRDTVVASQDGSSGSDQLRILTEMREN